MMKVIDLFNEEKKQNECMCCILLEIAESDASLHLDSNIIYELNKSLQVQSAIVKINQRVPNTENKKDALDCYKKMVILMSHHYYFNKLKQDKLLANCNYCIDQHIHCIVFNSCCHSIRIVEALSISR